VVTVFKSTYVIGKWLHVYHYFSSYRRKIEVFTLSVVFVLLLCVKYYIPVRKVYVFFEEHSYIV